jgi:hypothetical protein
MGHETRSFDADKSWESLAHLPAVIPHIATSLDDGVFEPEATALMGEAFEAACQALHFPEDRSVREVIATRIIAAARRGERDPWRLMSLALEGHIPDVALSGS